MRCVSPSYKKHVTSTQLHIQCRHGDGNMTTFLDTHSLFWWSWRDTRPSGRLVDTQEGLCRRCELSAAQTHKAPETQSRLSAGCLRPSAALRPGSPAQRRLHRGQSAACAACTACGACSTAHTYISTEHVVRRPHSDSIEPNCCNSVHAIKDEDSLLFGPDGTHNRQVKWDQGT